MWTGPDRAGQVGLDTFEKQHQYAWGQMKNPALVPKQLRLIADRLIALSCAQRGEQRRAITYAEVKNVDECCLMLPNDGCKGAPCNF